MEAAPQPLWHSSHRVDCGAVRFDPVFCFAYRCDWLCDPVVRLAKKAGRMASSDEAQAAATDAAMASEECDSDSCFERGAFSLTYLPRIQSLDGFYSGLARFHPEPLRLCRFFHLSNLVEPLKNLSHPLACAFYLSIGGSQASSRGTFNGNAAVIGDPVPLGCKFLCQSREVGGRFSEPRILTPNIELRTGWSGHRILHRSILPRLARFAFERRASKCHLWNQTSLSPTHEKRTNWEFALGQLG